MRTSTTKTCRWARSSPPSTARCNRARFDRSAPRNSARHGSVLTELDAVAAETGGTPAQVALAWLAAQPNVAAPLASANTPEQVRELCGMAGLVLSAAQLERLSQATAD